MPLFGAHLSIAGGFYKAVVAAAELGMDTVQIFTGSPQIWAVTPVEPANGSDESRAKSNAARRAAGKGGARSKAAPTAPAASRSAAERSPETRWTSKPLAADEVERFQQTLLERKIARPIAHSSYLINLASPDPALWARSVEALIVELDRADQLGVSHVVVHPGAAVDASEDEGIANVVRALDAIHERRAPGGAELLLENTAGQGSCLGWKFSQLAAMLDSARRPERLGVCFDTCHALAAGYPLASAEEYRRTFDEFDDLIGVERLQAFHLNDSQKPLGSRVDRHAHLGLGHVGLDAFRRVVRDRRFARLPMYLETPKGDHEGEPWDATNLRILRELARS